MNLTQVQAQRFYETLAMLIGNREGVDIKVTVTPREGVKQRGEQVGETYNGIQKHEKMRVS